MPVVISLVVCQAPSLLQSHKVEELALLLWGGWSLGIIGGVFSAYQTHLSWKKGSIVRPTDVVGLELLFTALMLVVCPRLRSQSLVAVCCGMLGMSSIVVELGRSRVAHEALSPEKALQRAACFRQGRKPPMALVAAVAMARHTVLVDLSVSFLATLVCLALSTIQFSSATAAASSSSSTVDTATLEDLPDFTLCFWATAAIAVLAAFHFMLVRYDDEMVSKTQGASSGGATSSSSSSRSNSSRHKKTRDGGGREGEESSANDLDDDGEGDGDDEEEEEDGGFGSGSGGPRGVLSSSSKRRRKKRRGEHGKAFAGATSSSSTSALGTEKKLNVIRGKWLALQAALSLAALYGGRFLCASLFGAFYTHLPTYDLVGSASYSTMDDEESQVRSNREVAVLANVFLSASALIGALLASNVVSRWTFGRPSRSNDLRLANIVLASLLCTAAGPALMIFTTNRALAWLVLGAYGGFNGFCSVASLALYSRRLPVVQAVRVSSIKAAGNGVGGLLPFVAAALWTAGYSPASDSSNTYVAFSASKNRQSFMGTLVVSALLPALSLALIVRQQRKRDYEMRAGRGEAQSQHQHQHQQQHQQQQRFRGGSSGDDRGLLDESDEDEEGDGSGDLESFFMDYRLKQMREKLAEASQHIEAEMEHRWFDDDEEGNPFGGDEDDEDEDDEGEFEEGAASSSRGRGRGGGGGGGGERTSLLAPPRGGRGGHKPQEYSSSRAPPPPPSSSSGNMSV